MGDAGTILGSRRLGEASCDDERSRTKQKIVRLTKRGGEWRRAADRRMASRGTRALASGEKRQQPGQVDEDEWVVESILGKRVHQGRLQYLIKWEGWDSAYDSWEDALNCQGATQAIRRFERVLKRQRGQPASEDTPSSSEHDDGDSSSSSSLAMAPSPPSLFSKPPAAPSTASTAERAHGAASPKPATAASSTAVAASSTPNAPVSTRVPFRTPVATLAAKPPIASAAVRPSPPPSKPAPAAAAAPTPVKAPLAPLTPSFRDASPSFARGDEARAIEGMRTDAATGMLSYMVVWCTSPALRTWVSSEQLRQHAPLLLIDYFEEHAELKPYHTGPVSPANPMDPFY